MRIVNGIFKGRRITAPKNLPTRPTTDMAKEALFNMLNNDYYFEDLRVLDLFAGTGNISYEFASREVKSILAIDQNHHCTRFIQRMKSELELEQLSIQKMDVLSFLKKNTQKFDVIFADPPYDFEHYLPIVNAVFEKEMLNEDGVLIMEHDASHDFSTHPNYGKHKRYGHVNMSFFYA